MCTLTIAWQVFDDVPIAVAANRDEALGRPSTPPALYETDPRIVAPRDEDAGGTWIGLNEHGVFAGIANRWVDVDLAGERSRGLLVRDVLGCSSAPDAVALVEAKTSRHEYDAFNLVVADADEAVYLEWDGALRRRRFEPGVHVVVNVGTDDRVEIPADRSTHGERQAANASRIAEALAPGSDESATRWLDRAAAVIADHDYGVCVHGDGYGTRSSSLVTIDHRGEWHYRFADGPPCEAAYVPVSKDGQL